MAELWCQSCQSNRLGTRIEIDQRNNESLCGKLQFESVLGLAAVAWHENVKDAVPVRNSIILPKLDFTKNKSHCGVCEPLDVLHDLCCLAVPVLALKLNVVPLRTALPWVTNHVTKPGQRQRESNLGQRLVLGVANLSCLQQHTSVCEAQRRLWKLDIQHAPILVNLQILLMIF